MYTTRPMGGPDLIAALMMVGVAYGSQTTGLLPMGRTKVCSGPTRHPTTEGTTIGTKRISLSIKGTPKVTGSLVLKNT